MGGFLPRRSPIWTEALLLGAAEDPASLSYASDNEDVGTDWPDRGGLVTERYPSDNEDPG